MLLPPFEPFELLKLIRLFTGLNQSQMAANLGVTQSWLSRLEAGKGELTLLQLSTLRSSMGVSADEMIDGAVPFLDQAARFKAEVPLPERYAKPAGARMLDAYPFIRLFLESLGEKAFYRALRPFKLPAFVIAEPRLPISPALIADVISICDEHKLLARPESYRKLVEFSLNEKIVLPEIAVIKAKNGGPNEIYRRFFEQPFNFSSGFSQAIGDSRKASLEIVVGGPRESKVEAAPGLLLCRFKRELFREVGTRYSGHSVELKETKCQFEDEAAGNCIYHVSWA